MLECMPIYDVFLFCSKLFAPFRGKVVQNCLFGATTHKNIDFTALNAGIRWERKIYFWNHLYHHDHDGRLIPASYVVPKINEYLILRLWRFFGPKSLLVGTPTKSYEIIHITNTISCYTFPRTCGFKYMYISIYNWVNSCMYTYD